MDGSRSDQDRAINRPKARPQIQDGIGPRSYRFIGPSGGYVGPEKGLRESTRGPQEAKIDPRGSQDGPQRVLRWPQEGAQHAKVSGEPLRCKGNKTKRKCSHLVRIKT